MVYSSRQDGTDHGLPADMNFRCLKSLKIKPPTKPVKPSHFFKTTARAKSHYGRSQVDQEMKECKMEALRAKQARNAEAREWNRSQSQ